VSIVQGLAPLPASEVKNYVQYRLKVAGHIGPPIFTDEAYECIAASTEGIPRNVNNLCFNTLSLACALRKKKVDVEMVKEVLRRLSPGVTTEAGPVEVPYRPISALGNLRDESTKYGEISSVAEAAAYMQQVALELGNWRQSLKKAVTENN
jgi:hypothetical protein